MRLFWHFAAVAFLLGACASVPGARRPLRDTRGAEDGTGSGPRCPRSPFSWAWPKPPDECRVIVEIERSSWSPTAVGVPMPCDRASEGRPDLPLCRAQGTLCACGMTAPTLMIKAKRKASGTSNSNTPSRCRMRGRCSPRTASIWSSPRPGHHVPHAGLVWHVDVYEGLLDGIVLAEVELPDENTDLALPEWVGAEITGRPDYKKVNLPRMRQAALARRGRG